jgi:hypothetical protein
MKVVYYGSCQVRAIERMMHDVLPGEVIMNYTHILDKTPLPDSIYDADILIYQTYHPTNESNAEYHTDNMVRKLRTRNPNARAIALPFICFYAYWPDNFKDERNALTITSSLPYGMFPQQSKVLSACTSEAEALTSVAKEHFDAMQVHAGIDNMLQKLKDNDEKCDVKIHDFISGNWQKSLLFFSVYHPKNVVITHVARQVLNILGLKDVEETIADLPELLEDHHAMILPCVQQILGISQPAIKMYDGKMVDANEYASLYYANICDKRQPAE